MDSLLWAIGSVWVITAALLFTVGVLYLAFVGFFVMVRVDLKPADIRQLRIRQVVVEDEATPTEEERAIRETIAAAERDLAQKIIAEAHIVNEALFGEGRTKVGKA